MGLRNAVMGVGALAVLVWTNPYVMVQVLGILVLVVLPSMWFGRRVRKLSRASQDRVADSSAIAAEVLNAIPVVQSYTAEVREADRFDASTENAFRTAVRRTKARSVLVAFIIIATSARAALGPVPGHASRAARATSRPATWARPWSTWPSSRARRRCSARSTATCCAPPAPPNG
jgi:ATP-binding cassette subfamily B protein